MVVALFVGPRDGVDRAIEVADRAGFCATRVHGLRSDAGFVQLLDVLTDETVDVDVWSRRTVETAATIMRTLDFDLVSLSSPKLV